LRLFEDEALAAVFSIFEKERKLYGRYDISAKDLH
jgi:hypothetical protein